MAVSKQTPAEVRAYKTSTACDKYAFLVINHVTVSFVFLTPAPLKEAQGKNISPRYWMEDAYLLSIFD